ncbi:MAG: M14 family zinc carboxypeptidase [Bacillota bacterium]|nr:M14 family zinc carboxypeptidase [Bacillota bacterium]MDW7684482.1 M14 family zinc carboxypeptidase [Bacillota bacterium]
MKKVLMGILMFLIISGSALTVYSQVYPMPENKIYTYEQLGDKLQKLATNHPDLVSLNVLGTSVDNRNIWSVTLGTGSKKILVTGAMHAREWVTTPVLTEMIALYIQEYHNGSHIKGEPVKHLLDQYSITFIPMLNPDGVTLVQKGADAFPDRKAQLLKMNHSSWGSDFRIWKANIRGVDINRNYDAFWNEQSDSVVKSKTPSYAFYKGPSPESEPETKVTTNWIRANNPELILDYHSMGELIYWFSHQKGEVLERDKAIVQAIVDASGYTMEPITRTEIFNTTMQQWLNKIIKITCVVVEVGNKPSHSLTMDDFPRIFKQTRYLPLVGILKLPGFAPYVPTISVNVPDSLQMVTQDSELLAASIFPADASNKKVSWSSNKPDVVSVDENGGLIALSSGSAYITATTESGGKQASSLVTVYNSVYDVVDTEPVVPLTISSETISVNPSSLIVSKLPAGMTAEELLAGINEKDNVKIYSGTTEISGDTPLGTGLSLKIMDESVVIKTYAVIVTGDSNGDGKITVTDMIAAKAHLLASSTLKGEALYAADTNGDGNVSITDFIQIKSHILGKEAVVAREY